MAGVPKKLMKHYKKQIEARLTAMNVPNTQQLFKIKTIQPHSPDGKPFVFVQPTAEEIGAGVEQVTVRALKDGEEIGKDGVTQYEEYTYQARNQFRNTTRTLLKSGAEACERFIRTADEAIQRKAELDAITASQQVIDTPAESTTVEGE